MNAFIDMRPHFWFEQRQETNPTAWYLNPEGDNLALENKYVPNQPVTAERLHSKHTASLFFWYMTTRGPEVHHRLCLIFQI